MSTVKQAYQNFNKASKHMKVWVKSVNFYRYLLLITIIFVPALFIPYTLLIPHLKPIGVACFVLMLASQCISELRRQVCSVLSFILFIGNLILIWRWDYPRKIAIWYAQNFDKQYLSEYREVYQVCWNYIKLWYTIWSVVIFIYCSYVIVMTWKELQFDETSEWWDRYDPKKQ